MSDSHECSGCGGTGKVHKDYPMTALHPFPWTLCPVCLGSGRISDVRTAEQAMVDANTLFRVSRDLHVRFNATKLRKAERYGFQTALIMGQPNYGDELVFRTASAAARAAFRAVPALRGEA